MNKNNSMNRLNNEGEKDGRRTEGPPKICAISKTSVIYTPLYSRTLYNSVLKGGNQDSYNIM